MTDAPLNIGESVSFSKTVSESDVYLFAGITGDLSPNHVDEVFMRGTRYGRRIAHGALIVGYMSRASTLIAERAPADGLLFPVSLGYDRIRLLAPVFIGDTITVAYQVSDYDTAKQRSIGKVTVTNERGQTVAVAEHLMAWLPKAGALSPG
jgi:3-hydroxybutyryl-CoA dehydratase